MSGEKRASSPVVARIPRNRDDAGQLGSGQSLNNGPAITVIPDHVVKVGIGSAFYGNRKAHACALLESGRLECWGANFFGQVGDGTQVNRLSPIPVLGSPDVNVVDFALSDSSISGARGGHTCAIFVNGTLACW